MPPEPKVTIPISLPLGLRQKFYSVIPAGSRSAVVGRLLEAELDKIEACARVTGAARRPRVQGMTPSVVP